MTPVLATPALACMCVSASDVEKAEYADVIFSGTMSSRQVDFRRKRCSPTAGRTFWPAISAAAPASPAPARKMPSAPATSRFPAAFQADPTEFVDGATPVDDDTNPVVTVIVSAAVIGVGLLGLLCLGVLLLPARRRRSAPE